MYNNRHRKHQKNNPKSIATLKELILDIGGIPIIIDEDKHDYVTAAISHVPHIVAASLVKLVKELDDERETMKTLAAGGFKDITRIASSDPTMWENICNENEEEIKRTLNILINILKDFEKKIDNRKETYNFFENSKKYRDSFINRKINGNTMPELNICIKDENGSIAKITNILAKNNVGVVIKTYEERDRAYEAIKEQGYDLIKIN